MTVLVTIGPTQEPLDAMRILSNRSTGELGTMLAVALAERGHHVIALRGTGSTAPDGALHNERIRVIPFTTTEDLRSELKKISAQETIGAVFHAAAVSDFYLPDAGSGKIPTSRGELTLSLRPTPKLLTEMRAWFPTARITGWKFEAGGTRDEALTAGRDQIAACSTDACVVNGPSYGPGFGVMRREGNVKHLGDRLALCIDLADRLAE